MSHYYNKDLLKEKLELEQIYDLLELWGGEPEYTDGGLIATTICHNPPGIGSRKLYYYQNTQLCHCYSGCAEPSFDIFDLCIKVMKIQKNLDWELYDAMDYIASYFGFEGTSAETPQDELEDWEVFKRNVELPSPIVIPTLQEYDLNILSRFSYPLIESWEEEGITEEVQRRNKIGYYPVDEQIVIPHFDINNRLIGIRGRYLSNFYAERYGKYRPLRIMNKEYSHPLSMNLYNINNSRECIHKSKIAIIFESEKSSLQYQSFYGYENDMSVACCGSNLSYYQVNLLRELGVNEIIIAFDRQFQKPYDDEYQKLVNKLTSICDKYKNLVKVSIIFDKNMITPYKASPTDTGPEIFEKLLRERIIL